MWKCGKECVESDVFGASWRRKKARRPQNSYARSCEIACDYSELGESMLCTRDLLSSNWRHTHMDIMSTLPSSLEAMKGCVCNKNEVMTENERTKNSRHEEKGKVPRTERELEPKNRNDGEMMFGSKEMNREDWPTDEIKNEDKTNSTHTGNFLCKNNPDNLSTKEESPGREP